MSENKKKDSNIRVFHKRSRMNIGIAIFSIIFVYLVVTVFTYLTQKTITEYEVRKGSILKDNSYTGLILREEQLVTTSAAGYVNYYVDEGSKTAVGNNVYTLSDETIDLEADGNEQETGLTADETAGILMQAQKFTENYTSDRFYDTYTLKTAVESVLQSNTGQGKLARLNTLIDSGTVTGLSLFQSPDDGVVVYSMDGYEKLTKEQVTMKDLTKKEYQKQEFQNNQKVAAGDPVFKLVTSEYWTVVIPMTEETAKTLMEAEKKSVRVKFLKDNESLLAGLTIEERDGTWMAFLFFDNSMIRYVSDRYVDLELVLEDQTGLKIPKTSVVEKNFYVVPLEYVTESGQSLNTGVLRSRTDKKGNETTEFVTSAVYYVDEENGLAYLDPEQFREGDILLKQDSQQSVTIQETGTLTGVYNINKGYAVFKQIDILCESDEYYIIRSGSTYGLSNYDHIALDGSSVKENAVVFE